MFARFKGLRARPKKAGAVVHHELTLENSGLTRSQQDTANNALKILGLADKQDSLTKQDFTIFLYAMGLNPTDDIIDSKVRTFKLHNRDGLTFGQLAHVWYSMLQDLADEEEILKRAFNFFDKDGNGEISVQELRTTMHELGDLLSEEEITEFMNIMDVNNDGVIEYTEFLNTLKTQTPELAGTNHALKSKDADDRSVHGGLNRAGAARREASAANIPDLSHLMARGPSFDMLSTQNSRNGRPPLPPDGHHGGGGGSSQQQQQQATEGQQQAREPRQQPQLPPPSPSGSRAAPSRPAAAASPPQAVAEGGLPPRPPPPPGHGAQGKDTRPPSCGEQDDLADSAALRPLHASASGRQQQQQQQLLRSSPPAGAGHASRPRSASSDRASEDGAVDEGRLSGHNRGRAATTSGSGLRAPSSLDEAVQDEQQQQQ